MTNTEHPIDVVSLGRVGVDLYPLQDGVPLEDVDTFGKFLGGSAANVAVAAARHGHSSSLISRTGDDPFGRYIRRELLRLGVSDSFITTDPTLLTPLTFCEIFPPDDFPLYFYRQPKAPDLEVSAYDLNLAAIADARIFWASSEVSRALEHVTIAVGNREECEIAVGETDPHRAADALLGRGVELAIVKQGPRGVLAKTATEVVEVAPFPVDVVNGLGAGDSFGGALCHGLLEGWGLERILQFANVAGALVASRREGSTAMPTSDEVEQRLAEAPYAAH